MKLSAKLAANRRSPGRYGMNWEQPIAAAADPLPVPVSPSSSVEKSSIRFHSPASYPRMSWVKTLFQSASRSLRMDSHSPASERRSGDEAADPLGAFLAEGIAKDDLAERGEELAVDSAKPADRHAFSVCPPYKKCQKLSL